MKGVDDIRDTPVRADVHELLNPRVLSVLCRTHQRLLTASLYDISSAICLTLASIAAETERRKVDVIRVLPYRGATTRSRGSVAPRVSLDRKSTRLNSSHLGISY